MKRWAQYKTPSERRIGILWALAEGRTRTRAAELLGVNRQHLYALMRQHGVSGSDTPDSQDNTDSPDTVATVGVTDSDDSADSRANSGASVAVGTVGLTIEEPLTYGRTVGTMRGVASAAVSVNETGEETVRVALDLPKSIVDWMEQEALRRKQRGDRHRMAKSPIVIEAIEFYRRKVESGDE